MGSNWDVDVGGSTIRALIVCAMFLKNRNRTKARETFIDTTPQIRIARMADYATK